MSREQLLYSREVRAHVLMLEDGAMGIVSPDKRSDVLKKASLSRKHGPQTPSGQHTDRWWALECSTQNGGESKEPNEANFRVRRDHLVGMFRQMTTWW